MGTYTSQKAAQHMKRDAQDVRRHTTLRKNAEARADRPVEVTRDTAVHEKCQQVKTKMWQQKNVTW